MTTFELARILERFSVGLLNNSIAEVEDYGLETIAYAMLKHGIFIKQKTRAKRVFLNSDEFDNGTEVIGYRDVQETYNALDFSSPLIHEDNY